MSELNQDARWACIRDRNDHYFLAVKPPLEDISDKVFQDLSAQADSVHELKEGSQVFVFPHERFGTRPDPRAKNFRANVRKTLQVIGNVYYDGNMTDTREGLAPNPVEFLTRTAAGTNSSFAEEAEGLLDLEPED
jgi:hypothetical protein